MYPWLWLWAPQFQFPFSGSVAQRIEPDTRWFFAGIAPQAGNGELEQKIHEDIASYGRQLGLVTEVLLGLAGSERARPDQAAKSLARLEEVQDRVEALKQREHDASVQAAVRALEKLAATDPAALEAAIQRLAPSRRGSGRRELAQ
jgi:hypothetical protein